MLRTTVFGGIVPKLLAQSLPDNAAQTAQNIAPDTTKFRPYKDDLTVLESTGVDGPKTIHRLQRDSEGDFNNDVADVATWIIDAEDVSYARGQVNGDVTERTVKTFNNGSAPARMIDATGDDRQLGVPVPTSAPTVAVIVVDEFTPDDRQDAINAALLYMSNIIHNPVTSVMQPIWKGSPSDDPTDYRPGTTHTGYVDRDYVPGLDPEEAQELRVFRLGSTGGDFDGALSDSYADLGVEHFQWVLDPSLHGFYQTSPTGGYSWPTWAGTNQDHWCIPFHTYGLTWNIHTDTLSTLLAAMEMPFSDPSVKLWSNDQVTEVAAMLDDLQTTLDTEAEPKLNAIKAQTASIIALLGGGSAVQQKAALEAFYAITDVAASIDAALDNFAETVWNTALAAANYVDYVAPGGGEGGP